MAFPKNLKKKGFSTMGKGKPGKGKPFGGKHEKMESPTFERKEEFAVAKKGLFGSMK